MTIASNRTCPDHAVPCGAVPIRGNETGFGSAGFARLVSLPDVLSRLARLVRGRRAVRVLSSWNDSMLADIGLTRADIDRARALPVSAEPTSFLGLWVQERRAALRQTRREAARRAKRVR